MMVKSEKVALPIHFFCPFSTQPSAVRLHVVVSPPAVPDPTNGSVNPKAPIFSKRCIAASHSSFCASDPHIYIEPIATPLLTPKNGTIDGSIRPKSIAITPYTRDVPPAHP